MWVSWGGRPELGKPAFASTSDAQHRPDDLKMCNHQGLKFLTVIGQLFGKFSSSAD